MRAGRQPKLDAVKSTVEIFTRLGERLANFGEDARSSAIIAQAAADNGWFTREDMCSAVSAIRREMLCEPKLRRWLAGYDFAGAGGRRVLIVMAGNIPLVGFYDLLCTIACGHCAVVKPSAKDRVLVRYVVELLREIEPGIEICECEDDDMLSVGADAVIATGSDNARRRFKAAFAGRPQLLRGSRHSVAVLSGDESVEQLSALQRDIMTYSGLGCRNVSMVFVPAGFGLRLQPWSVNPKFRNNYRQTRALLHMRGAKFADTGSLLVTAADEFPAALSLLAVHEYGALDEVERWLAAHDEEVQCVVSECVAHPRRVGFGESQSPRLEDAPDDVDVIRFLLGI